MCPNVSWEQFKESLCGLCGLIPRLLWTLVSVAGKLHAREFEQLADSLDRYMVYGGRFRPKGFVDIGRRN